MNRRSWPVQLMRVVFSSTLASSLFIHALLGCCWQHPHDAESCGALAVSCADADCNHEHGAAPAKHPSHGPCKNHSHCQCACSFLPVQKSQIAKSQCHVPMDFAAGSKTLHYLQAAAPSFAPGSSEVCTVLPLRIHLLNQSILI